MNRVSVIVPVYNSSRFIRRCLDSILAQSYSDFEAILIDDGSEDDSLAICLDYQKRDSRFHVFHTDNFGVSHARNTGLELAEGTWVCFVDSDDYLEPDYLSSLVEAIKKHHVDMVLCSWFSNDDVVSIAQNGIVLGKEEALYYLFSAPFNHSFALWNKIFVRECISTLKFDESLSYLEDGVFICSYLRNVGNMAVIDWPLYHYNYRSDSLSHDVSFDEKRLSSFKSRRLMIELVSDLSKRLHRISKAKYFEHACYVLFNSYIAGHSSQVVRHKRELLQHYPSFLFYDSVGAKMKIRYSIYALIVLGDLGEKIGNRFETYRLNRRKNQ